MNVDDNVTQPYAIVVLIGVLAAVSFLLGWSRRDQTLVYVGHTATALVSIAAMGIGPLWVTLAGAVVFVANLAVLLIRLRRAA